MSKLKLHHLAYNIYPNTLETTLELFNLLGCELSYREGTQRWCMVWQSPVALEIQLIEASYNGPPIEHKINTHVAFLSKNPQEDVLKLEQWAKSKKLKFIKGSWSNTELWFDLPDIFVNFVIEVLHTSVVE